MGRQAKGKNFKGIKEKEGIKKMNDIFMCLLINLRNHGNIKSAMFNEGFTKVTLVDGDDEFDVSVIKREKVEEDKND